MITRTIAIIACALSAAPALAQDTVTIEIDDLGVPRIVGETRADAVYALGYMHGRDRFFQMDLARRNAAGRLSEVVGEAMLPRDIDMRRWDFSGVAQAMLEHMSDEERAMGALYVSGVNDGLASLPTPPEYLLVGASPEAWTMQDSALCTVSLVDALSHGRWRERALDAAREAFPAPIYDLLHPFDGTSTAPIVGGTVPPAPIPGPEVLDLRTELADWVPDGNEQSAAEHGDPTRLARGSNNWAIGARKSADGRAILATDPHLQLSLPNTWYRAEMQWGTGDDAVRTVGVTLPGMPLVLMGSNGHLAWGMTNVTADFEDTLILTDDIPTTERIERIMVRGRAEPVERTFIDTPFGIGVPGETDRRGRPVIVRWTGVMPEANTLDIFGMATARTLEEGLDVAAQWKSAPQNIVIASADGRVGWTMSGYLPKRIGTDGSVPFVRVPGKVDWAGEVPDDERPRVIRDAGGAVWSANSRVSSIEDARWLGYFNSDASRAARIREVLSSKRLFNERDMMELQLDTRAQRYDPFRDLALRVIPADTEDDALRRAREAAKRWTGHADIDDTGHHFVRTFEDVLTSTVFAPFEALIERVDPRAWVAGRFEHDTTLRLIEAEPMHLLSPEFETWDALVLDAARRAVAFLDARYERGPATAWGETSTVNISHPIAQSVGPVMPGLSAPEDPLPGDWSTLRVNGWGFGASVRIVVAPGHEEHGLIHMPGGQSGRPGTPNFLKGHDAWVEGRPLPLLTGEAVETLELEVPASEDLVSENNGGGGGSPD